MARISTYPIDTTVDPTDLLIGTDSVDSSITKNYTIQSIIDLQGGYINAADVTGTSVTAIGAVDTIYPMAAVFTAGLSNLWSVRTGADANTILYSGTLPSVFLIIASVVASGGVGDVVDFFLHKNGTPILSTQQQTEVYPTGQATVMTMVSMSAGDYVGLSVRNDTDADDVTTDQVSIAVHAV